MSAADPGARGEATAPAGAALAPGRLVLVPNALDLGTAPQDLTTVLPHAVLQRAARLHHWLVEDAKSTRAFLRRVHAIVPLHAPLQALAITELPRPAKGRTARAMPNADFAHLLAPALAGHDVGLLSEAGLPAVADPGAAVVAAAHALGLAVLPLPGPSSLVLALAASGLEGQSFAFVGYLPQEATARGQRIRELEELSRRLRQTQIFIETPYRNAALFHALLECAAPATRVSVSVALTLPEGWCKTATVSEWRRLASKTTLPDRLPAVFLLQA